MTHAVNQPAESPSGSCPDWLADAVRFLERLPESLPADGDRDQMKPSSLQGALSLLSDLAQAGVPAPYIYSTRRGTVQLEWESGGRYFEIELVSGEAAEWYFSDSQRAVETTGFLLAGDSLDDVVERITAVTNAR